MIVNKNLVKSIFKNLIKVFNQKKPKKAIFPSMGNFTLRMLSK
ncbi:hypothetical protein PRO82_001701 [Candidatus Protochlamydia amoebophila]|nr:hypothetical protein [Candidatus Protochlamydia amoebophila]